MLRREERILKARKDDLDDEERQRRNWGIDRWVIKRADPFLKEVKRNHFEPRVISLGLFGRRSWNGLDCGCRGTEEAGYGGGHTRKLGCGCFDTKKAEQLKLDVAIKFITDIAQDPITDWRTICRDIVKNPRKMRETYEGLSDTKSCCDNAEEGEIPTEPESDDELECIQSALTLDAIFVTSILAYFARDLKGKKLGIFEKLEQTFELILRESGSQTFFRELMLDIFKLENQIPLELIKETIKIMFESFPDSRETDDPRESDLRESDLRESDLRESDLRESDRTESDVGDILQTICARIVMLFGYYFPSFQYCEQEMATDDAVDFRNCHHLLHCVAHAIEVKFRHGVKNGVAGVSRIPARTISRNEAVPQRNGILHSNGILHGNDAESPPATTQNKPAARDCFISKSGTLITATQLSKAGIELKAQDGFFPKLDKNRVFGTLHLPRISAINEYTEQMWRNLLAFEEPFVHQDATKPFIHYLKFMDHLINTKEDVELLCSGKDPILQVSQLGDYKEVADLFNIVSKRHIDSMEENWTSLRSEIMAFHTHSFRVTTVEFMDKFFSRPWFTVSLIVGAVILVLSFLQSLYGMLGYYRPQNSSR